MHIDEAILKVNIIDYGRPVFHSQCYSGYSFVMSGIWVEFLPTFIQWIVQFLRTYTHTRSVHYLLRPYNWLFRSQFYEVGI